MKKEKYMNFMISRSSNETKRIFPQINPSLYNTDKTSGLTQAQKAARHILSLANKDYTRFQRLWGQKLDTSGKIGRLLLLHKTAMLAELEKQWTQADFYWERFFHTLKSLYPDTELWKKFTDDLPGEADVNPEQLRQRIFEEIFIDTQCAFYNGRIQQSDKITSSDRAFDHIRYIKSFLNLAGISEQKNVALYGPMVEMQMKVFQDEKKWEKALQLNTDLLANFPEIREFQNNLALLLHSKIIAELSNGESKAQNLSDANKLESAIQDLEKHRKKYRYHTMFYEVIGDLHHLRAIKLATAGNVAEALVDVQKSSTYAPYMSSVRETYDKLAEMMTQIQTQIAELERQVASNPNMIMNAEGLLMQIEARKGFEPVNAYIRSSEAKQVSEDYYRALAQSTWLDIGFSNPETQGDEKVISLLNGIAKVLNNPPDKKVDIETAWQEVIKENAELADLDSTTICKYLKQRLFDKTNSEPLTHRPTFIAPENPPTLATPTHNVKQKSEPFGDWLFSNRNIRIKLQAVVAVVLLIAAGTLTITEFLKDAKRDKSYQQIINAAQTQNNIGILNGAEIFFSNPPLIRKDNRQEQVKAIYDEAIVRWYVSEGNELNNQTSDHLNKYRKLMISLK